MDLSLITARLTAQAPGYGFKSVGQSADLAAAKAGMLALPGVFLVPMRETATASELTSGTHQQIVQTFAAVIGLVNRRDASGAAAVDALHPLRMALRTLLVGWVPDAATGEPVHFSGGALLELDTEFRLWWSDEFQLTTYYWSA